MLGSGSAMEASQGRVSFFSLSAELRNRIYEHALVKSEEDGDMYDEFEIDAHKPSICMKQLRLQPALTRTCRKIRPETLALYYGRKRFTYTGCEEHFAILATKLSATSGTVMSVESDGKLLGDASDRLRAIGRANAALIKSFDFRILHDMSVLDFDAPLVPYNRIVPYANMISTVLSDYLKRENIHLHSWAVRNVTPSSRITL